MVHDQADELRYLARQHARSALTAGPAPGLLAVSGGKGGVGATTVSLNMAVALARLGHRTVWVDADLNRAGGADWWRSSQRGSLVDVLAGRRTIHEVLERGPGGVQLLAGAWAPGEIVEYSATVQQRFIADLKQLGLHADSVVLDLGNSRSHFVRRFWQAADMVLLVSAADATTVMESYAAIKVLSAGDGAVPIQLLVNFADATMAAEVHERVSRACRRFLGMQLPPAIGLPASEQLALATAAGDNMLRPSLAGTFAEPIERLAETLWSQVLATKAARMPQHRAAA